MTVTTTFAGFYGPETLTLGGASCPWYIGRGPAGDIALYTDAGAAIVRAAFLANVPMARRAVRACRRARNDGPMRLRVTVSRQGPGDREYVEEATVYGWRAALVAVRAMREEFRPGDRHYQRRWLATLVSDARLDAVLWPEDES